ncbi:hypothetical protein COCC4DRAFT_29775, partial [Bipolaris maydis ATCC 48331]
RIISHAEKRGTGGYHGSESELERDAATSIRFNILYRRLIGFLLSWQQNALVDYTDVTRPYKHV